MNYSKVQYEQMLASANQLKKSAANMQQILNDVTMLINKVGNSDAWNGAAAINAKAKFDSLVAKLPEFYNATDKCYSHLVSVVENYKSVDSSIANG